MVHDKTLSTLRATVKLKSYMNLFPSFTLTQF